MAGTPHPHGRLCQALVSCVSILMMASPRMALAWPGYAYDDWKQVTTWTKPDIQTDQAGRTELVHPLATDDGAGVRINEIRAWEKKRSGYADAMRSILGAPGGLEPPKPQAEVLGEETLDDHIRRHIRIRSETDDWIPAFLLLPKDLSDAPRPAMICVHQTVAQGKREPCGIEGKEDLAFALQLVRRGFVCIAPDMIGFGERIPAGAQPYADSMAFYRKHPNWSFMGKMIWDMSRVVDYLETLPFVDPGQIGSIGHSHGAYTTLFATAFEPRISLAIASCGFTTLRSDPSPNRWSHLTALIPQLGTYLPEVRTVPFDWQHICSMIAPRPLFVWYGLKDDVFPETDNLDAMLGDVRDVYGLYGAADDLAWHAFGGAHGFPEAGRTLAYRWMEDRLFPVGVLKNTPTSLVDWNRQRVVLLRAIRRTIGTPTGDPPPLDVKVLESDDQTDYERQLIEYTVDREEHVKAYLCVPKERKQSMPAVLVLHQTSAAGKREPVGLDGDVSLAFADDLSRRGYITLSPDSITAGDRIDSFGAFDTRGHYLRHQDLSAMGKMLFDAQRALDVLADVEGVDRGRIGTIGHSLGAEEALMLAAFDARLKATVASCGYATFAAETNRMRWARDQWFSYMPKLRPVFAQGRLPCWDWDDVVRLIAPRGVYHHTTREDNIFLESVSAYHAGEEAKRIWRLYGTEDRFVNVLKPGEHAIAAQTKTDMYDWLDRMLIQRRRERRQH